MSTSERVCRIQVYMREIGITITDGKSRLSKEDIKRINDKVKFANKAMSRFVTGMLRKVEGCHVSIVHTKAVLA